VAAVRTLACPAIGFFRSVPFPRADDTLLSEALAFEVSIFNGAAFLGAPPRGDAARAAGAFRGDPARGTPDVPSALGDIVSRGRPQGFARLRLDFGEKKQGVLGEGGYRLSSMPTAAFSPPSPLGWTQPMPP
jgi:hypothetical protein